MNLTGQKPSGPTKALVISMPKSGTYLMGEVLKNLSFTDSKMHLIENGYSDYSGADLDDARLNPQKFARKMPLVGALHEIGPGEFAVGHIKSTEQYCRLTSRFRRIFLIRELRHSLISYMRFVHSTGRFGATGQPWYHLADPGQRMAGFLQTFGELFLEEFYRPMTGWLGIEEVLTVRFEDLTGESIRAHATIDAIAAHVGVALYDAAEVLQAGLSTDTMTKSPRHSRLDHFWSNEAEQWFTAVRCHELNTILGYGEATWQQRSVA